MSFFASCLGELLNKVDTRLSLKIHQDQTGPSREVEFPLYCIIKDAIRNLYTKQKGHETQVLLRHLYRTTPLKWDDSILTVESYGLATYIYRAE